MTDHGGAASPRTDAGKRLLGRLYRTDPANGAAGLSGEYLHGRLRLTEDILGIEAEAAQEAPAPEGLRPDRLAEALWETSVRHIEAPWIDAPESERTGTLGWAMAILDYLRDATPSTPAEPPLPEGACGVMGLCERRKGHEGQHTTSVDRVLRAEARPPEGLDPDRLARALGTTNRNGWANGVTPLTYMAWAKAIAAEYARLSAGGATKP